MVRPRERGVSWRQVAKWARMVLVCFLLVLLGLILVVLIRTAQTRSFKHQTKNSVLNILKDGNHMKRAERLSGALKIETVSYEVGKQNNEAFLELHKYIKKNFPLMHSSKFVQHSVVNKYSLLYTITGSDNGNTIPYLLYAHTDVVPANPDNWEIPPFSGQIVNDTYVYGRGTIDNKGGVMGLLEALEYMISQGEQPKRTFYLSFGHDEEVYGTNGAQELARELHKRGVYQLDFVLDEGFPILVGVIPGTQQPVAVLGVTEKGFATVQLSVNQPPGHSSFPPKESAIGILARAITRLEEYPQPSMFGTGPEAHMFEYLAPDLTFGFRALFSNLWLFSTLLVPIMERDPKLNAMMRTTTAITIINGGHKSNVVPPSATAIVNHRIHPTQTVAEVLEHDHRVVDDPRVTFTVIESREAHPVSPHGQHDLPYQLLAQTVRQTYQDTLVAPGVLIANTDSKWYLEFTKHLFRFFPTQMTSKDTARYHGDNERIGIEDYNKIVQFYYTLIKNADSMEEISTIENEEL